MEDSGEDGCLLTPPTGFGLGSLCPGASPDRGLSFCPSNVSGLMGFATGRLGMGGVPVTGLLGEADGSLIGGLRGEDDLPLAGLDLPVA